MWDSRSDLAGGARCGPIFALHAEETEFRLFVDSATPVIGKLAVREQFKNVFLSNPGYSSTMSDIQFGPNLVYIRYLMCMDAEMLPKLYDVDSFLVIRIYRISRDKRVFFSY